MFARLWQHRPTARGAEFCESCGQVCTVECRAQARVEYVRAQALYQAGVLR